MTTRSLVMALLTPFLLATAGCGEETAPANEHGGYQILCQQVTCDGTTILTSAVGPASGGQACAPTDVSEADGTAALNAACQAELVANGCAVTGVA